MPAIFLLVFFIASITTEPIFFGGRRGRHQRPIPTLPPLPSRFRLGSHRAAAPRFTVQTQYIDAPALKSFQNSIDTKETPAKEHAPKESDIISFEDIADISGEIVLSDDVDAVTEIDVEDSTATEAPAELRELKSEVENNKNSLLNENTNHKSVTDTLLDIDGENVILDSIFAQNVTEQSLVTDSFFTVINEKASNNVKIPNFVKPSEVVEHFTSEDVKTSNFENPTEILKHFISEDIKIPNWVNPTEVVEHFISEDVKIPNFVKPLETDEHFISEDVKIPNFVNPSKVVEHFASEDIKIPNFVKIPEVFDHFSSDGVKNSNFVRTPELANFFISEDNSNKISTNSTPTLLAESVTETVANHIIQEFTTTESVLVTFTNRETESITVTHTEYSSISYTPVFITVTDLVVETDCVTVNLPNTVTEYDTETVTTRLTEYIQYSQITVPAVKTVTDTIYSTTTVTPSPFSIVQTITDLLQVRTCTCVV